MFQSKCCIVYRKCAMSHCVQTSQQILIGDKLNKWNQIFLTSSNLMNGIKYFSHF